MKEIRTKKYLKYSQFGIGDNYPPGVTGNEDYFKGGPDPENGKDTIEIERNWDEYEKWYNAFEAPGPMPYKGITTIFVHVSYTADMNVGFGESPKLSLNVISITDKMKKDLSDFQLTDKEEDEIKSVILENRDF